MNKMSDEKTVLVHMLERVRPVRFRGSRKDLLLAIRAAFSDVPNIFDGEIILQVGFNMNAQSLCI